MSTARPLIEWLGARWKLGAPVVAVAWDRAAGTACGALGDGTLAIVHASWDGGPAARPRREGGIEVVPARQTPPPAMRIGVHAGPVTCLVADLKGGFLSGGADGRLVHADADGAIAPVAQFGPDAPIQCVAARGRWRAAAAGHALQAFGAATTRALDLAAPVTALAFASAGDVLAAAHGGGLSLWNPEAPPRRLDAPGTPVALGWSPDGAHLAAALQQNALLVWRRTDGALLARDNCPEPAGMVRFGADGSWLATSRTGAIIGWAFDPASGLAPIACGIASRVPTSAVAPHPRLAVVAAGYVNGAVMLCQPGSKDVLFVRAADGDAVSALGWSADGGALALGTASGELGLAVLPEQMFRTRTTEAAEPQLAQ